MGRTSEVQGKCAVATQSSAVMQNDSKGRSKVAPMEKREKRYRVRPVKSPTFVLKCCELARSVLDATDVRICMEGDRHWGIFARLCPKI